jgi:hypothetical protein
MGAIVATLSIGSPQFRQTVCLNERMTFVLCGRSDRLVATDHARIPSFELCCPSQSCAFVPIACHDVVLSTLGLFQDRKRKRRSSQDNAAQTIAAGCTGT